VAASFYRRKWHDVPKSCSRVGACHDLFLRGGGDWIAGKLNIRGGFGLAIFALALTFAAATFFTVAGAALSTQVQQFWDKLPNAFRIARSYIEGHAWMSHALDMLDPQSLVPSTGGATSAVSSTLGVFANFVMIAFIGLYGAIAPNTYIQGTTALVAPSQRRSSRPGSAGQARRCAAGFEPSSFSMAVTEFSLDPVYGGSACPSPGFSPFSPRF
jgi:hypothetical protein